MSDNARRIARALEQAANSRAATAPGRTKTGRVASLNPLTIETGPGARMPGEALLWSNSAMATRDDWMVGDSVVMSMVEENIYIVQDVLFTGEVLGFTPGEGGGGVTLPIAMTDVTGLTAALAAKAALVHTHTIADVTGLGAALAAKADLVHTHAFSSITGSISAGQYGAGSIVNADISASAAIAQSKIANLTTDLAAKAALVHTHPQSDVTNLVTDLAGKASTADARFPTTNEKAALVGTSGTAVSVSNKLVDNADTRMTNARTPTAHTHPLTDLTGLAAGQVIYGVGAVPTAGTPDAAGLVDKTNAQTIGGIKTFTSYIDVRRASQYDSMIMGRQTGDAQSRVSVLANGEFQFGDGTNNADVTLYRWYAANMGLKATLNVREMGATADAFTSRATGDSNPRFAARVDGRLTWGPGTSGFDVKLERTAPNELTLEAGDVLKLDTRPFGTADTTAASTAFVQAATGSMSLQRPAALLTRSAVQSVATGTWTKVQWTVESVDNDNMFTSGANTRLTVVSGGTLVLSAYVALNASAGGSYRIARILKNGTTVLGSPTVSPQSSAFARINVSGIDPQAVPGDYYEVEVIHDIGSSIDLQVGTDAPRFSAAWVGGSGAPWGNASGRAARTTAQSISNGAWNDVTFNSVVNSAGMTVAASTVPLTCVVAGTYSVTTKSAWLNTSAGSMRLTRVIHKNQAGVIKDVIAPTSATPNGSSFSNASGSAQIEMDVGDFLQMQAYQDTGAALNTASDGGLHHFSISASRQGYQTNPSNIVSAMPWQAVTFSSGWSSYGGTYGPLECSRDTEGNVHIRGLATKANVVGSGGVICTLPVGMRPALPVRMFTTPMSTGSVFHSTRIDIDPNGVVSVVAYWNGPSWNTIAASTVVDYVALNLTFRP